MVQRQDAMCCPLAVVSTRLIRQRHRSLQAVPRRWCPKVACLECEVAFAPMGVNRDVPDDVADLVKEADPDAEAIVLWSSPGSPKGPKLGLNPKPQNRKP